MPGQLRRIIKRVVIMQKPEIKGKRTYPIEPGDLLTASDTPGHAMKVTDYTKAHGAILGKAMSSLESGKGLVLVLVSLQ